MDYTWENLTSREFEVVACNFASDMFPSYNWKLTDSTRDDNHDFYTQARIPNKWGEAKHSNKYNKTISRAQWDPTLISAKLINSVNDILLITCAYIPLSYIIRSFNMTVDPIANIYCINRLILNEWYEKKQHSLSAFNTSFVMKSICNKINVRCTEIFYQNDIQIYIFSNIEKNYLTALKKLISNCEYAVNIALFVEDNSVDFKIEMGEYISIIDDVIIKNISFCNQQTKISCSYGNSFECKISKGYSVITFHIITKNIIENNSVNHIQCLLGDLTKKMDILVESQKKYKKNLVIDIEKKIAQKDTQNKIIKTDYVPPYLLNRPNFKFIYICFDERFNYNYNQLCRLWTYFLTGIDFQELDEISLRENLYLCDYPDYFEDIILGIFSDSISKDCMMCGLNNMQQLVLKNKTPNNVIYILENTFHLKEEQKDILRSIELAFVEMKKNSFIVYQNAPKKLLNIKYNDETALIGIFETGIKCQYIDEKKLSDKKYLVRMDIDKTMYFPSINTDIIKIKKFILNKKTDEIKIFFDKIIYIASNQIWSSRVLDFILLIEKHLPDNIFYDIVRRLRDIYYERTDFYSAYNYSKILCRDKNKSIEQDIEDKYKEADELNHCGSIVEARKIFAEVANTILKREDSKYLKKGLEALTEVYNISFWLLDVKNLEQSIDKTIDTYFPYVDDDILTERDLYPYYNCLNRKMVVQYFFDNYTDAENTFKLNLEKVKLDNYIAFAYMDSARGLYNKDIYMAYERIKKAIEYLEKLFNQGKEMRRYYDCLIEKAYVEFILAPKNERLVKIKILGNAVYNAKKYGYKNITQKSYFKLAACFMVLGNKEKTKYFLEKIRNNLYFSEAPRNQFMYNDLMKGYHYLKNNDLKNQYNIQSDFCDAGHSIEFKCFENEKSSDFFIETRMW